jgi:hypothetical protein
MRFSIFFWLRLVRFLSDRLLFRPLFVSHFVAICFSL